MFGFGWVFVLVVVLNFIFSFVCFLKLFLSKIYPKMCRSLSALSSLYTLQIAAPPHSVILR